MTTQKNAVCYVDGVPHLELNADFFIFSIFATQRGERHKILFKMRPYLAGSLKEILPQISARQKVTKDRELVSVEGDTTACEKFFDDHFIEVVAGLGLKNGEAPPKEAVSAFLDKNPNLKVKAVLEGYGGIFPAFPEDDADAVGDLIFLDLEEGNEVHQELRLYCPERKEEVAIRISHPFAVETPAQRKRWKKAQYQKPDRKAREVYSVTDYSVAEQLYQELIGVPTGIALDGHRVTEEDDPGTYLDRIPFWLRLTAIESGMDTSRAKN